MPHDCAQTDKLRNIHDTLERLDDGYGRLVGVLERIAEQGAVIQGLVTTIERHDKNFEDIFRRTNALEVRSEGERVKVGYIMAGVSAVVAYVTALLTK
jgi:hypothetical protein